MFKLYSIKRINIALLLHLYMIILIQLISLRTIMIDKKFMPYLSIIMAVIFWGVSYISTDICLNYMQPITLSLLRCLTASTILYLVWKIKHPKMKLHKSHIFRLAASGTIGIACYSVAEFYGVKFTSPAVAAIILAAIPIFSLIAERFINNKRLNTAKILGVVLSLVGVVMVMGIGLEDVSEGGKVIGYFSMFLAAASWVIYNYISIPLYKHYSPFTITTFQMIFATIVLVPVFLLSGEPIPQINLTIAGNILFLAGLCSAVGFSLYMFTLRSLGMVTTTLFINIQPLVTVIAAMLILNEFLNINQVIGGILVIGAVYLSTYQKRNLNVIVKEDEEKSLD